MRPAAKGRATALAPLLAAAFLAAATLLAAAAPAAAAGPEWAWAVERGHVYRLDVLDREYQELAATSVPDLRLEHLALAADGLLYGTRGFDPPELYRVDPATGQSDLLAALTPIVSAVGVAADGAGGLWVASLEDRTLYRFDAATGAPAGSRPLALEGAVFARFGGAGGDLFALTYPAGPSFHPRVERIDPATGAGQTVAELPAEAAGIAIPRGVAYDGGDGFWVVDNTGEIILGLQCFALWRFDLAEGDAREQWQECVFVPAEPALDAFAIDPSSGSAVEIPALAPSGLALLALALAAAGLALVRRRRAFHHPG